MSERAITMGGAIAHPLEQAAGAVGLVEGHPVWTLIDDLRDAGDDERQLRALLARIAITERGTTRG